jgi:hypothetical protein
VTGRYGLASICSIGRNALVTLKNPCPRGRFACPGMSSNGGKRAKTRMLRNIGNRCIQSTLIFAAGNQLTVLGTRTLFFMVFSAGSWYPIFGGHLAVIVSDDGSVITISPLVARADETGTAMADAAKRYCLF